MFVTINHIELDYCAQIFQLVIFYSLKNTLMKNVIFKNLNYVGEVI